MILLAIVALPFACGRPWKTPNYSRFENTFFTYLIYLIIAAPFVFGFIWDYNIRGDTSPPETVGLRIERKYIDHNEMRTFYAEAPDGVLHFFLKPSQSLYDEYIEGDIIRITIHKGALGYMWIEDGYIPPPPKI